MELGCSSGMEEVQGQGLAKTSVSEWTGLRPLGALPMYWAWVEKDQGLSWLAFGLSGVVFGISREATEGREPICFVCE